MFRLSDRRFEFDSFEGHLAPPSLPFEPVDISGPSTKRARHSASRGPGSYFGLGRGVTYYNFVSDQHTGFHAIVVPGTLRDALLVLDGLLEQRTRLEPDELMTDTAGYGDVMFGLFWLLGYQFSPRLRDIADLRYWSRLRQAVVELGRMVKTLYLLAYISDADYRRRILVQLNRGESRHTLARAVLFGRQ